MPDDTAARKLWEQARAERLDPPYNETWETLPDVHKQKWRDWVGDQATEPKDE